MAQETPQAPNLQDIQGAVLWPRPTPYVGCNLVLRIVAAQHAVYALAKIKSTEAGEFMNRFSRLSF